MTFLSHALNYPSLTEKVFLSNAESYNQRMLRYVSLMLTGSLLIALCAQITVPFYPVPMTMQTFAIFLIGLTFGWRLGGWTVALYLTEGALGLPVFAGAKAGMAVFMGPTGGYLIGFFIAATVCGWFAEKGFDRSYLKLTAALLIGNILLYAFGLLWLGTFLGWDKPILEFGFYPFVLGDLTKIALVVVLLPSTWKLINRIKQ